MKLKLIKDIDKHPSFNKWIIEFDTWCKDNGINQDSILLSLFESPHSKYGMALSIQFKETIDFEEIDFIETYYLDKSGVEDVLNRFKTIEIPFFKIKVLDKMKYLKKNLKKLEKPNKK